MASHVISNSHLGVALTKDLSFFRLKAKASEERNLKYVLKYRWRAEPHSGGSGKVVGTH